MRLHAVGTAFDGLRHQSKPLGNLRKLGWLVRGEKPTQILTHRKAQARIGNGLQPEVLFTLSNGTHEWRPSPTQLFPDDELGDASFEGALAASRKVDCRRDDRALLEFTRRFHDVRIPFTVASEIREHFPNHIRRCRDFNLRSQLHFLTNDR